MVKGLNTEPAGDEPTVAQVNVVHLAWDLMIGFGTLLCLLGLWYWASWIFRTTDAEEPLVPARRRGRRASQSVISMEAGWTVSEVGRQPWIVANYMKVEAAATGNTGVWLTFLGVFLLYVGLGVTTILVLRGMGRRYREQDGFDESDSPYGPAEPSLAEPGPRGDEVGAGRP